MQEDLQLISKLKELKNISPRKEWVALSKIQILQTPKTLPAQPGVGIMATFQRMFFQKKFAYAFAVLAVLVIGAGFMQFGLPGDSGISVASPEAIATAKNNVEMFKVKSQELARVAKSDPKAISVAVDDVKAAAKQLKETIQKDPGVAREIALEINNNKTYLAVDGGNDLAVASNDLYKTVVEQMIKDLQKASLTESQQDALAIAKDLYEKDRFTDALESILLLSMAIESN